MANHLFSSDKTVLQTHDRESSQTEDVDSTLHVLSAAAVILQSWDQRRRCYFSVQEDRSSNNSTGSDESLATYESLDSFERHELELRDEEDRSSKNSTGSNDSLATYESLDSFERHELELRDEEHDPVEEEGVEEDGHVQQEGVEEEHGKPEDATD